MGCASAAAVRQTLFFRGQVVSDSPLTQATTCAAHGVFWSLPVPAGMWSWGRRCQGDVHPCRPPSGSVTQMTPADPERAARGQCQTSTLGRAAPRGAQPAWHRTVCGQPGWGARAPGMRTKSAISVFQTAKGLLARCLRLALGTGVQLGLVPTGAVWEWDGFHLPTAKTSAAGPPLG